MFTIKDLARETGYTVATVSRALNDNPLVSAKTKQKILDIAEANGYAPNALARNLVTQSSSSICVIVPDISNPYFPLIVKAVQQEAHKRNYFTIVCNSEWKEASEVELAKLMYGQRVAGIIMDPSSDTTFQRIRKAKVHLPIVFVGNRTEDDEVSSVLVDNKEATEAGVAYLVQLGHKEIAFIGGQENTHVNRWRREGFCAATKRLLGRTNEALMVPSTYQSEGGYSAMKSLLDQCLLPSAVMAINDTVAFGVIRCLKDAGYRVPQDVSVIGFDDVEFSEYVGLTTIHEPRYEMGVMATKILMDVIQPDVSIAQKSTHVLFHSEIIVRDTCAPPAAK